MVGNEKRDARTKKKARAGEPGKPKHAGAAVVSPDLRWCKNATARLPEFGFCTKMGKPNISAFARSLGIDPKTMNRFLAGKTKQSHIAPIVAKALKMPLPVPPGSSELVQRFAAAAEVLDADYVTGVVEALERAVEVAQAFKGVDTALAVPPKKRRPR